VLYKLLLSEIWWVCSIGIVILKVLSGLHLTIKVITHSISAASYLILHLLVLLLLLLLLLLHLLLMLLIESSWWQRWFVIASCIVLLLNLLHLVGHASKHVGGVGSVETDVTDVHLLGAGVCTV